MLVLNAGRIDESAMHSMQTRVYCASPLRFTLILLDPTAAAEDMTWHSASVVTRDTRRTHVCGRLLRGAYVGLHRLLSHSISHQRKEGAAGEYGTRTDCGLDCADARTVFSWLAVGH